jgi:hypothetical protein
MAKKSPCSTEVSSWIVRGLTLIGGWRDFIKGTAELPRLGENLKSPFKWAGTKIQTNGLNTAHSTTMHTFHPSVHKARESYLVPTNTFIHVADQ